MRQVDIPMKADEGNGQGLSKEARNSSDMLEKALHLYMDADGKSDNKGISGALMLTVLSYLGICLLSQT